MQTNRPFFSVIIPCYNSKETIGRLLQSIVDQQCEKEDIQVVISDDCSTESYQEQIQPFLDKLIIKQVKTDYNCCPGNTRQRGVDNATGKWIIFSDHDDTFNSNIFPKIKNAIVNLQEKNSNLVGVFTAFNSVNEDGSIRNTVPSNKITGWTHGKFFNLDDFWKKYNIHYIKDLASHQDVCINSQLTCILHEYPELLIAYSDIVSYNWLHHQFSLSNKTYKVKEEDFVRPFLDLFFTDYLDATGTIALEKYKQFSYNNKQFYRNLLFDTLLMCYFYTEFAIYWNSNYLRKNYEKVKYFLNQIKQLFNCDINYIYQHYFIDNRKIFSQVMQNSIIATGYIIYQHTFKEWLIMIDNEKF